MYSIFAALIVGTIIVTSCAVAMTSLRNDAVNQQLSNVDEYIATQSLTLINQVNENGQNATQVLDLPTAIGNQEYWVSLDNDSSSAWVESGFGSAAMQSEPEIYIPADVSASGAYVSGWGNALLQCCIQNQTVTLTLTESD
jgi:hypothetical protein